MNAAARPGTAGTTVHDRLQVQRERILDAARQCFIEHGFHGASMAQIAQAAGISVGLAYRYFDGKHAIMLAIIDQQLQYARERLPMICHGGQLLETVLADFSSWQRGEGHQVNAALFLETSAEGTRSHEIAQALQRSDAWVRQEFQRRLGKPAQGGAGDDGPGDQSVQSDHSDHSDHNDQSAQSGEDAAARALLLQCLIEGLLVRAARDPQLDAAQLRRAMLPVQAWLAAPLPPQGPNTEPAA